MANYNLTSQQIKDTYEQLTQISGSVLVDGTGSAVNSLEVSASYATSALTASYALNAEGVSVDTGSLLITASAALNVITFTKGDNSTFNVTVDTGSAGGGGLTPSEFYTYTASNDARVDSLTAATSSYLTSADISGKLDTSVFNTYTSSNDSRVDSLTAATSSYLTSADISGKLDTSVFNAYTSSNDSTVAGKLDTSVYTSNSSSVASRLTTNEGNISTNTSDISTNSSNITSLTSQTSSYAKTNVDNVFTGTQTFNNIAVNGTGSFAYIQSVTGSAKIIGDAFIVLNADSPTERYAGIKVYDSGSSPISTGSFQWDSVNNDWFYEYEKDATDYAVTLFGPEFSTKGTPTYPTTNSIQKGTGGHHLGDSLLSDDGSTVSMTGTFDVTGAVSSSVGFKGDLDGNASTATTASFAVTASYVEGGAEAGLVSGTGTDSMKSSDSLTTFGTTASGNYSIALGRGASTSADSTIAIGPGASAEFAKHIAIGSGSRAASSTGNVIVIGQGLDSNSEENTILIGSNLTLQSSNNDIVAIGHNITTSTNDNESIAIGNDASINGFYSVTLGDTARSYARGVSIGYQAQAGTNSFDTVLIGYQASTNSSANNSVVIGANSSTGNSFKSDMVVIGHDAFADQTGAVAVGEGSLGEGNSAVVIGKDARARSTDTIAIGRNTYVEANKDDGIAIGALAETYGEAGIAIGFASATGPGDENTAIGGSAAAGFGGEASNNSNTAVGYSALARGVNDVVVGANSSIDSANDNTVLVGASLTGNVNDGIAMGYNLTLSSNNEINIGDKFKYDGTSAITLDSSTIKVAASGSQTGSLIDNIHPAIASSSAQINHIVTITQDQYTALSGSGDAKNDTIYVVSDEGDYIHNGNLGISGQLYSPFSTSTVASSTSSIDFNEGNFSNLSLTAATYIDNPSNLKSGTTYTLVITSGSLISNFNTAWKFAGGTQPTFSNGTDVLTAVSDGTNLYATALADFS